MAHIKTFARIKPSRRVYEEYEATANTLYMRIPDVLRDANGAVKTRMCTVNHEFKFTQVFDTPSTQQEVFDAVAKDIIDGFLNGYNGTIFAYGQTGSGKTFTVEGAHRLYEERGLAPRALSMIYNHLEAQTDVEATIHVSYMEIYQEVGYDLLNQAARSSSAVTPFPKVAVVEGSKGSCVVRNLSSHLAASEAVAQSLLLQGQANRKVAETPMNQRSSRSHAVFTIQLTVKKANDEIITRSKLHLVDLAGSERVSKTGINGRQLAEAKYINLSLHYLEGVIIALHQDDATYRPHSANHSSFYKRIAAERLHPYRRPRRSVLVGRRASSNGITKNTSPNVTGIRPSSADGYRTYSTARHVPYRNSLLTMVLKDSLGGNCLTAMIATVSMDEENLSESISTCRFSQRVACITNTVRRNEEIDDKLMIKRLRKRIAELETELALLRSGVGSDAAMSAMDSKLTDEDKRDCVRIIQAYIGGSVTDPIVAGICSPLRFKECMRIFKTMVTTNATETGRSYRTPLKAWAEDTSRPSTAPTDVQLSADVPRKTKASKNDLNTTSKSLTESLNDSHQSAYSTSTANTKVKTSNSTDFLDTKMALLSLSSQDAIAGRRTANRSSYQSSRISSRTSYKSPFERKREKTIKLLAEQVKKKRNEQEEEMGHLRQFKSSVVDQQLQLIREELKAKADENKKLLETQQARVKQIKNEGVDELLYQQEKVVERQLRKRQAKMDARLRLIEEQIELLQKQKMAGEHEEEKQEVKEADFTNPTQIKGFGTVINSRVVLDKLQEEDKKQQKRQDKMERDRLLTLSQQIEVKEAATRQKLRDFKEKLSLSRNGSSLSDAHGSREMDSPQDNFQGVASPVVDLDDLEDPLAEREPVRDTNKKPATFTVKFDNPFKNMNSNDIFRKPSPSNDGSMEIRERNPSANLFMKKDVKNLDELWSKSYTSSRPSSWMDDTNKRVPSRYVGTDAFANIGTPTLGTSPIKDLGYEDLPEGLVLDVNNDEMDNESSQDDDLEDQFPKYPHKIKSPREVMKSLEAASKQITSKYRLATENKKQINADKTINDHQSKQAARRHNTFESALQSMLAMEGSEKPGPLTIGPTEYNEFARSNRQDSMTQAHVVYSQKIKRPSRVLVEKGASSSKRKELSNSQKRVPSDTIDVKHTAADSWGPESKNISMSDRLSRYLDSELLPSRKPRTGRSYEDADASPYKTPTVLHDSSPAMPWNKEKESKPVVDMNVDDFTPRIKALPEKKRETAYMNTVKEQKDRVSRIRKARRAAEVIQRAWAKYRHRTGRNGPTCIKNRAM